MRPPGRAPVLVAALVAAGAGCRSSAPPSAPLPSDWRALARTPEPFVALYRLSCCGQRGLLLSVRGGDGRLALSVTVPPGAVAIAAWVEAREGWVERVKQRCREPLPSGVIPLSGSASLPLDAGLAASLLSGLLPPGVRELPAAPGWVEGPAGGLRWRARVEGPPPRCTRVEAFREGESAPALVAELGSPVAGVPSRLTLLAGRERAELELQEWRGGAAPQAPAWLALPACPGAR